MSDALTLTVTDAKVGSTPFGHPVSGEPPLIACAR